MMPRNPILNEENRERFRGYIAPEIWQQMARYGMGRGSSFPGTADIPHQPGESEFLVMMLKAYKEQEDEKRRKRLLAGTEYIDPMVEEAGELSGR